MEVATSDIIKVATVDCLQRDLSCYHMYRMYIGYTSARETIRSKAGLAFVGCVLKNLP